LHGVRRPGSEVCFYRGLSPADPVDLYFSYDRVACLPADDVLDFPPGLFHVFARSGDKYVSGQRDYFNYIGAPAPEAGYQSFEIPLEEAAIADFSAVLKTLRPAEKVGVWVASTSKASGTFFPLVDGETSIVVPAARPFLPILIGHGAPIAIGAPLQLGGAERKMVPSFTPSSGRTVIAWLKLDPETRDTAVELTLPDVNAVAGDVVVAPVFPLYDARDVTLTPLFFRDIRADAIRVQLRGRTWVHSDTDVSLAPAGVTVHRSPILLLGAAAVTLSWRAGEAIPAADHCASSSYTPPLIKASLERCVVQPDGKEKCDAVAKADAPFHATGTIVFEGVVPGTYRAIVDPPFLKPISLPAELPLGSDVTLPIPIEAFTFFGTVTLNGEPVATRLVFGSGEALSGSDGHFNAALAADPLKNLIRIISCDDARVYTYLPKDRISPNAAYPIELHVGDITVDVSDARGLPVPDATVSVSAVKAMYPDGPETYNAAPEHQTSANGRVLIQGIPSDKALVVCVQHHDYAPRCTDVLQPADFESKNVTVQLNTITFRGRVEGHQGSGSLAWVNHAGRVTEEALLDPSGTFTLQKSHDSAEYVVYTAERSPLVVLHMPLLIEQRQELVFTLPAAQIRSFTVSVPGMVAPSGFVGVWIGGSYVPLDVLAAHQDSRGQDVRIYRGRTLRIADIAETGPIAIAFAPEEQSVASGTAFVDVFTVPPYSVRERTRVTTDSVELEP